MIYRNKHTYGVVGYDVAAVVPSESKFIAQEREKPVREGTGTRANPSEKSAESLKSTREMTDK